MKFIQIFFILLILSLSFLVSDAQEKDAAQTWKYLTVNSTVDSTVVVLNLVPGTVVRKTGEGLSITTPSESYILPEGAGALIDHAKAAPHVIRIDVPHEAYSVENLPVTVRRIDDNSCVTDTLTDLEGIIEFVDLPPGVYSVDVQAQKRGLIAENIIVTHRLDDSSVVLLDEFPLPPVHLDTHLEGYSLKDLEFTVGVVWNQDSVMSALPYSYLVRVDDMEPLETSDRSISLPALCAGKHQIGVTGVLPTGRLTEEKTCTVILKEPTVAFNVEIGVDPDSDWQYYDLQGARVNPENLSNGIYVRTNGTVAEKLIITSVEKGERR